MTQPMPPLGPIVITAREVYDAVVRLTGRVDVLIAQQTADHQDVTDHEARIRSLERTRWRLPALSTVVSAVALVATMWHR